MEDEKERELAHLRRQNAALSKEVQRLRENSIKLVRSGEGACAPVPAGDAGPRDDGARESCTTERRDGGGGGVHHQ